MVPSTRIVSNAVDRCAIDCAIECLDGGTTVGVVQAYSADLINGTAWLSVLIDERHRGLGWPIEGVMLFAGQLFIEFGFEKLYFAMSEQTFAQVGDALVFADYEGHLRDRLMINGERCGQVILALQRDIWVNKVRPLIESEPGAASEHPADLHAIAIETLEAMMESGAIDPSLRLADIPIDSLMLPLWITKIETNTGTRISSTRITRVELGMTINEAIQTLFA